MPIHNFEIEANQNTDRDTIFNNFFFKLRGNNKMVV